jgi:hypothetical protein
MILNQEEKNLLRGGEIVRAVKSLRIRYDGLSLKDAVDTCRSSSEYRTKRTR